MGLEQAKLENSEVVIMAHPRDACIGYYCTIHYRSMHHMRDWSQNWREDRGIMERVCEHGVGHPDPDDHKAMDQYEYVHGCDGCCSRPHDIERDALL